MGKCGQKDLLCKQTKKTNLITFGSEKNVVQKKKYVATPKHVTYSVDRTVECGYACPTIARQSLCCACTRSDTRKCLLNGN